MIQAFTPALRALNQILSYLVQLSAKFNDITAKLFGKQTVGATQSTEALNGMANAQDNLATSTDKATKASKRSLASFDKLNQLGSTEATGGGVGGLSGTAKLDVDTGDSNQKMNELSDSAKRLQQMLEPLRKISFENLVNAFKRLKESAGELGKNIWSGLEWAYYNILVPLAKWTIEDLLPAFINLLSGALDVLNSVLELFKPLGEWLWENFLKPIAEWTGGIIVDVINGLADALTKISDWIDQHQEGLKNLGIIILSVAGTFGVLATITAVVGTVLGLMASKTGILAGVGVALKGVIGAVSAGFTAMGGTATLVITIIGLLVGAIVLLITHWDEVKEAGAKAWEWIQEKWQNCANWFKTVVIDPTKRWFTDFWNNLKTSASSIWNSIKQTWGVVAQWFKDHVTQPIKDTWASLKGHFKSVVNSLITMLENGINFMIRKLNTLQWDVPEWVPLIGGKKWGFNMREVHIPKLAKGAVLPANREFMAVLGDQKSGKNLEAPEGLIREIVREESGSGIAEIKLSISDKLISEAVIKYINGKTERVGVSPIKGV